MSAGLASRVARLERERAARVLASAGPVATHSQYADDLPGFIRDVLGVSLTDVMVAALARFRQPPYRLKLTAGHSVGKSHLKACLALAWHHTRAPSVVVTTAPTLQATKDVLWTEMRLIARRAGLNTPFAPAAPEAVAHEDHWMRGYTAANGEAYQGRHRANSLFLMDEDEGLKETYYTATNGMFVPDGTHGWVSSGNPTTNTSASAAEEFKTELDGSPKWPLVRLSCLDHPNVLAGLLGEPPPIPNAVTAEQADAMIADWCEPVADADVRPGDFHWRGRWYRPGPEGEARILGRRPTTGSDSVWGKAAFDAACVADLWPEVADVPELGVDVARRGTNYSAVHSRCGPRSIGHRTGNGWLVPKVCEQVAEAANEACEWVNGRRPPGEGRVTVYGVPIKVDDDGVGGGVSDLLSAWGYTVVRVSAGTRARRPSRYGGRRDELWFGAASLAAAGLLSLAALPDAVLARLRVQLTTAKYDVDGGGRRVVEDKNAMEKRLKRSPDDADALNLAYAPAGGDVPILVAGQKG